MYIDLLLAEEAQLITKEYVTVKTGCTCKSRSLASGQPNLDPYPEEGQDSPPKP